MAKKEVDMYYRFTSDEEPTDEQLEALMEGVGEKVRRENAEMHRKLHENIQRMYEEAKEYYDKHW
ncbi:MAG: hypothetical protein LBJ58_05430 [Tannerellaceae bacterium]|jgi:hypothetical protein|nr:hypothetical protein [Tannerellaceae bacterium]